MTDEDRHARILAYIRGEIELDPREVKDIALDEFVVALRARFREIDDRERSVVRDVPTQYPSEPPDA